MRFIDDFLDEVDFGILFDVIEHYSNWVNYNATEAVTAYKKFRERDLIVTELYGDFER